VQRLLDRLRRALDDEQVGARRSFRLALALLVWDQFKIDISRASPARRLYKPRYCEPSLKTQL
jgi:hypothetical protein